MPDKQPAPGTGHSSHRFQLYFSTIAVISVLFLAVDPGSWFLVLEDQLCYIPPASQQLPAAGSATIEIAEGQAVYVPVYSPIYSGGGEPHLLEVTLSIRNTDPERTIQLA